MNVITSGMLILLPEDKPQSFCPKVGVPEWHRFSGNNHLSIERPIVTYGGSVCFGEHIGQPLTLRLWNDLMFRLCISGLCIYWPSDAQWTIGWGAGHCCLQLDDADCVEDIQYFPVKAA